VDRVSKIDRRGGKKGAIREESVNRGATGEAEVVLATDRNAIVERDKGMRWSIKERICR